MTTAEWEPDGWWRAVLADGSLWAESSDEAEVRQSLTAYTTEDGEFSQPARDGKVQRHERRVEERWVDAPDDRP